MSASASESTTSSDHPPQQIRALLERIERQDRAYFQAHPNADSYLRPYYPGECWPATPLQVFDRVRVVRLERGGKMRIFLCADEEGEG